MRVAEAGARSSVESAAATRAALAAALAMLCAGAAVAGWGITAARRERARGASREALLTAQRRGRSIRILCEGRRDRSFLCNGRAPADRPPSLARWPRVPGCSDVGRGVCGGSGVRGGGAGGSIATQLS